MKAAIVGLPGSGKTTLFSALTSISVNASRKDNVGMIKVFDERIASLSEIFKPKKTIYAEIRIEDFGQLTSENFEKIRHCDTLIFVIDNFSKTSPLSELKNLESEFNLMDMALIEKRIIRLKKEDPKSKEITFLNKINSFVENGRSFVNETFNQEDLKWIKLYEFFLFKPVIVVTNSSEDRISLNHELPEDFNKYIEEKSFDHINLCATLEKEISRLPEEEQMDFLKDYNLEKSAKNIVITKSYKALGLQSFFTVGTDEVRAWTITKGVIAKEASGKIHSDLERGFIRAEVISFDTFMEFKDLVKAKGSGKLRIEGKSYLVQDGDILNIRFNV